MSKNVGQRAFHGARSKKEQKAEVAQLFERAVSLQKTGLIPDAQAVYRQLLKLAPRHFDALYLLGMSEYHARSYQEAERHLSKAAEVEPRSAKAHLNRGVVLYALGRFEEAGGSYKRAIALDPGYAVAWNNLGNVCLILQRLEAAIENYDKALAAKPDFPNAWYNRGLALQQLGRHQEALLSHQQALALDPIYVEALVGQGSALRALGRLAEALHSYDRAVAINPNFAEAFNNRGNILRELKRLDEARECFDKAIAIKPDFAEAHNGRGGVSTNLRDYDQAIMSLGQALAVRPNYPEAFANRGAAWLELKRFNEAVADYERALTLAPGLVEGWVGLGNTLHQTKRYAEAIACCERALALDPQAARAHALMGHCLMMLSRIDEAIAKLDDALRIKPDLEDVISLKIFVLDFAEGADFEQHRDVRRLWWQQIGSRIAVEPVPHRNVRDPQRRLVVGYVSADFREHSAARAFKPVLQYADKARFETVCYCCSVFEDRLTGEFRQMADRWRDASQWTDDRLAAQIRQDGVDILVDLSGHTSGHRLGVFARKPAPIQVHGWGHGTPPGLPTIDYVFSDAVSIPPEVRHLFTETIYDLPCFMTLDPLPADVVRLAALPALANGFVTFGVFNRVSKISDVAVEVWAQILERLPRSKLLIKDGGLDDALVRSALLARFARCGASSERIDLLGATPRPDHLATLNKVDIILDPFPQNGGVSTWEALQMGVPVVAKLGNTLSGRVAGSILAAIGMTDWVAATAPDYVEIAVKHGSRLDELAELRRGLPARIAASTAGNPEAYAAEVAKAYRHMWQIYCAKQPD
jgi:predicted O-linked N-acetylglucosamine transferase (SPINDLY family)